MRILATPQGFVLIFASLEDIQGTIENLTTLRNYTEAQEVDPPHIYACYDDHVPVEEIDKILDGIKKQ